jgi:hypothetical protein
MAAASFFRLQACPSVPPEVLEAIRREGGVAHGQGNRPMARPQSSLASRYLLFGHNGRRWNRTLAYISFGEVRIEIGQILVNGA